MGHKNKKSLNQQMFDVFQSKLRIGESKYNHKQLGDATSYIFSWSTYKSYAKHAKYFLVWCRATHKCKTLKECRQYADEWIQGRINQGKSAYTIKLEVAALCKLYSDVATDYIPTPKRLRKNITRSRLETVRDNNFSEKKNADLVEFCKSTGLRRSELRALTGDKLIQDADGNYRILVNKGSKGGKTREALIIGNVQKIVKMMQDAGTGKVFKSIPIHADIHNYRAEYATSVYLMHARPIKSIKNPHEIYYCRKDRRGTWFDRNAMRICSENLGHHRVCVVGEHYIRI